MAKTAKIVRWNEWQRGFRFKSGHKRGEKVIDIVGIDGTFYYCRHSHRATCRTHPLAPRGSRFWKQIDIPQVIFKSFMKDEENVENVWNSIY